MGLADRLATITEIIRHPGNAGRRAGAVVDYLRWNLGHRAMGVDYVVTLVGNARLIVSDRQNYATLVYTCGLWDFAEQAFMLHLLRPGDLFADIGANVGGYTVLASAVARARAIAFEPVPATYADLQRNLRLNDIDHLVTAHCCALGEVDGHNWMTAHRGGLNHIADATVAGAVEVVSARLDTVLANEPCRLMKLDAEGFERSILRGAPDTLANPGLDALIIELNGSGTRYGVSDDDVHGDVCGFGFDPCSYDARTRTLSRLPTYRRDGLNTIYARNHATLEDRLRTAPSFTLRGWAF